LKQSNKIENKGENYKFLIHLDRLSITFKHWSGSTFNDVRNPEYIQFEQVYKEITLLYDDSPGLGAYYHSYKVYYKGSVVGRLHTATKLKKHEVQFDFAKDVFYAFYPEFWYNVYYALKTELGLIYNNIMYMEVSVDTDKDLIGQYGYYYKNTINNQLRLGDRYKLKGQTKVHVMDNGASFVIAGTDNEISLYNKSKHAEKYILDYFSNNGLVEADVFRIESRLNWNYIRYLRNKKGLDINVETLTNPMRLANIFRISTTNKLTFKDTFNKTIINRNNQFEDVSIIDDLSIETAEIGRLNPQLCMNHYKTNYIDENIMRQNYYRYLETGNIKYLHNFNSSCSIAGYNSSKLESFLVGLNLRYKGNRTDEINQRIQFARRRLSGHQRKINELMNNLAIKFKSILMGFL
jgi:hypothetical protein